MSRRPERLARSAEETEVCDERFRTLVEQATELIVELDRKGRFLYVSPGARDTLGWEPGELADTSSLELVHPEDLAVVKDDYKELDRTGKAQSIHRALHSDGSWRWIQDTVRLVRNAAGQQRVVVIGRDVTDHKQLEAALERQASVQARVADLSRQFLAMEHRQIEAGIRASLPVAADLADVDRVSLIVAGRGQAPVGSGYDWARPDCEILPQSSDLCAIRQFTWSARTLSGGGIISVSRLDALPHQAAAEAADLRRRGVGALLALPVSAANTLIGYQIFECAAEREWTEQDVNLLRLFGGILASAIKRKQNEEEMERRSQAEAMVAQLSRRFMALGADEIDAAIPEALRQIAALAGADRSCLYLLPGEKGGEVSFFEWCAEFVESFEPRFMRWSSRQVARGEVFQIRDPASLPDEAAPERESLQRRGVRSVLGIPLRSGERTSGFLAFECMSEARRWSQQDETLLRTIGEMFTVAIRRRRAEIALRESRAQLLQAQKLEAVGRLAGGIAHDFNNLLTVILGFSGPILAQLEEGQTRQDLAEVHAAAERAAALTRQLLTFSRRQAVATQPVDLNRTVERLGGLLRRLLGEDIELVTELASEAGCVEIDPHQLDQVIMNVAVNARDAMPDGGSLDLRTESRQLDELEARRLGLETGGHYVAFVASDSGCGIDAETRARIFDPFFTTKEPGKGTGLGLAIAYSVVEQAGGAIAVGGEPDKGTTFEILLPCLGDQCCDVPSPPERFEPAGDGCVLLVEDEPAVRRLAHRILREHGYEVLAAENGEEALALAREHTGRLDALVTDVVMPRMGGGELARRLRLERPDLGVLFISGYPAERHENADAALPRGAFLQKPFSEEDLLAGLFELQHPQAD